MRAGGDRSKLVVAPPVPEVPEKGAPEPKEQPPTPFREFAVPTSPFPALTHEQARALGEMDTHALAALLSAFVAPHHHQTLRDQLEVHRMDGKGFLFLSQADIDAMLRSLPVGPRVRVLALANHARVLQRVVDRQRVIASGEALVMPQGQRAKFDLTPSSLRLRFQDKQKVKVDENKFRSIETNSIDCIDMVTVEDVDYEERVEAVEVVEQVKVGGCLCCAKYEERVTRTEEHVAVVYISLNATPHSRETGKEGRVLSFELRMPVSDASRKFHDALVGVKEEMQQVANVHFV